MRISDPLPRLPARKRFLVRLGLEGRTLHEVLAYCESPFRQARVPPPVLPLQTEPPVATWRQAAGLPANALLDRLKSWFPQLSVPIRLGISRSDPYDAVVRRGASFSPSQFGGTLTLSEPRELRLAVRHHPAGALPILSTSSRLDFETLFLALACKNEPRELSPSINAQLISGLVNQERLGALRADGTARNPSSLLPEVTRDLARPENEDPWICPDRLLLICRGRPYSGVDANTLGLESTDEEWLGLSDELRIEHEMTHYATKRIFGVMRRNLLDELLADLMGLSHVFGDFGAERFLRLIGIEALPHPHFRGRGTAYVEGLSTESIVPLSRILEGAAHGLEELSARLLTGPERARCFLAAASLDLDLLASDERAAFFAEAWEWAGRLLTKDSG